MRIETAKRDRLLVEDVDGIDVPVAVVPDAARAPPPAEELASLLEEIRHGAYRPRFTTDDDGKEHEPELARLRLELADGGWSVLAERVDRRMGAVRERLLVLVVVRGRRDSGTARTDLGSPMERLVA